MKKLTLFFTTGLIVLLALPSCEDYWTGQEEVITKLTISNGNIIGCPGDSIKFWALDQNGDTTSNVYWHSTCNSVDSTGFMVLPLTGAACHIIAKAFADNVTSDPILVATVLSNSCNDDE